MTDDQRKALADYQAGIPITPEQRAMIAEYQASVDQFRNTAPEEYGVTGNMTPEMLGESAMGGIETDPKYKEHELAALRELETQSREGFTASDRADMARVESQTNRANRGRIGAIQQSMQNRGSGGTGMELVAQMQSADAANEMAALKALEREGMMQDRKSQATRDLGTMSANLQGRDFGQAAQKARARDQIKQFNVQNSNSAQQANLANRQNVANMNVQGANQHAKDSMTAGMAGAQFGYGAASGEQDRRLAGAQVNYNAATEEENRRLAAEEAERKRKAAKNSAGGRMIGTVAGGVLGTFAAPGVGTAAGATMGGELGAAGGSYLSDKNAKKDIKPEDDFNIEAFLATIEPKSYTYKGDDKPKHGVLAQDLEKSIMGRDMVTEGEDGLKHVSVPDAISALLASVAHLNKKMKGG